MEAANIVTRRMATRREFLWTAAAAASVPGLAWASAPAMGDWLARRNLGEVYLVHARTKYADGAAVVLKEIESALGLAEPRHRQQYGSAKFGELWSLDYSDGLHVDLVSGSGEPGIEITFRGTNGSATYVAG